MFKNLKIPTIVFLILFSAQIFAANPTQPFLPSDNVQDPNCTPADSNCYVAGIIADGGNSLGNVLTIGTNDSQALQFETNSLTRMTVLANGNVGIGTTTPAAKLTISGNLGDTNSLLFAIATSTSASNTSNIFSVSGAGVVVLNKSGASNLVRAGNDAQLGIQQYGAPGQQNTITMYANGSANNVLAGYSTPGTADAPTATPDNALLLRLAGGGYTGSAYSGKAEIALVASENWSATSTGAQMLFYTTANASTARLEKMRLTGAGFLGLGTSTPADRLQVFGDIRVGTTGTNGCIKDFSGTVITGTCSSDERLKTDIVDLTDGYLEKMAQLKTVTYHWNDLAKDVNKVNTSVTNYGLLAQNVESIFPELVSTDSNGYKQVNYSRLPIYLLKGLQELSKKFASLADSITTKEIKTGKLCVDDVCVTKDEFRMMLQNSSVQPASPMVTITPPPEIIIENNVSTTTAPEEVVTEEIVPVPSQEQAVPPEESNT